MNKCAFIAGLAFVSLLASCDATVTATESGSARVKEGEKMTAEDLQLDSVPSATADVDTQAVIPGKEKSPDPALQYLVDKAVLDLAETLHVEISDIEFQSAEFVTWRDSSLGCPEPGNEYMQVLTKGARILLAAKQQVFEYHSGGNREPFLCRKPAEAERPPYGFDES